MKDYADVLIDSYVCTSGAMSGVHCLLRVSSTTATFYDNYDVVTDIYLASGTKAPYYAAAPGDSGGPVLVPYPDNNWSMVDGRSSRNESVWHGHSPGAMRIWYA